MLCGLARPTQSLVTTGERVAEKWRDGKRDMKMMDVLQRGEDTTTGRAGGPSLPPRSPPDSDQSLANGRDFREKYIRADDLTGYGNCLSPHVMRHWP